MPVLTPDSLPAIQRAITEAGLDGWLLFEFRGMNPIALQVIGLDHFLSRRIFVFVPREGVPVAITHNIEQGAWRRWPAAWTRERYSASTLTIAEPFLVPTCAVIVVVPGATAVTARHRRSSDGSTGACQAPRLVTRRARLETSGLYQISV
ncbi:MAG: hypothetical protein ACT4P7_05030 [Gemmatimonadaceae bacterium]